MTATLGLPPCPRCGSPDAVEIVYGYPTAETFEASERGEVVLGGCVIGPEAPDYVCRTCHSALPWIAPHEAEEAWVPL